MKKSRVFIIFSTSVIRTMSCLFLFLANSVYGATVLSTFDSNLDGWTGTDIRFVSTLGNPPGALEFQELFSANATYAYAPAKFLGDWSASDGAGTISFDHFMPNVTAWDQGYWGAGVPREIILSGLGGEAIWTGDVPAFYSGWTTNTAPLNSADWVITSGTWGGLLTDVTSFRLRVDHFNDLFGAERTQFDNIIVGAVPIPPTLYLFGSGLLGLIGISRRKKAT